MDSELEKKFLHLQSVGKQAHQLQEKLKCLQVFLERFEDFKNSNTKKFSLSLNYYNKEDKYVDNSFAVLTEQDTAKFMIESIVKTQIEKLEKELNELLDSNIKLTEEETK
jgi:hypothetical protein